MAQKTMLNFKAPGID